MSSSTDEIISAAVKGDAQRVAALLDADPSLATASNMMGSTAVHAAHYSGHDSVVQLLLSRGRTCDGFLASDLGLVAELRKELDRDPLLPKRFNAAGSTPLHGACYWGSAECARLLLERGADVNAVTRDSFLQISPLGCAVASPDVPNPSQDEAVVLSLVELLLRHGADPNGRRRDGMTPLHSAAYRGHLRVIRALLQAGADINARAYDDVGPHSGQTPLDTALALGQTAAAELLRAIARPART